MAKGLSLLRGKVRPARPAPKAAAKKKSPPIKLKKSRPATPPRKLAPPKQPGPQLPARIAARTPKQSLNRPAATAVAATAIKRPKAVPTPVEAAVHRKPLPKEQKPSSNGKVLPLPAPAVSGGGLVAKSTSSPVAKSKRNLAGLVSKELAHFRDLLVNKRHEILGDMHSMEREALRVDGGTLSVLPVHTADMGTDNYEQEFTLGLVEKERSLLREIYAALAKMQTGTYGICEGTGLPISKARLEVQPWARYSIEFARQREKSTMGIR